MPIHDDFFEFFQFLALWGWLKYTKYISLNLKGKITEKCQNWVKIYSKLLIFCKKGEIMQIVWDNKDPSGFGMFSKTGRQSSERYSIIRQRNEILANKRKVKHVSLFSALKVSFFLTIEGFQQGTASSGWLRPSPVRRWGHKGPRKDR